MNYPGSLPCLLFRFYSAAAAGLLLFDAIDALRQIRPLPLRLQLTLSQLPRRHTLQLYDPAWDHS
eukprot:4575034-Pleurochrysis_carterae.AAC.2